VIFPAWTASKRKWCPYRLWNFVMSSRAMGWPVVHRVLQWIFNKMDKPTIDWMGRCRQNPELQLQVHIGKGDQ